MQWFECQVKRRRQDKKQVNPDSSLVFSFGHLLKRILFWLLFSFSFSHSHSLHLLVYFMLKRASGTQGLNWVRRGERKEKKEAKHGEWDRPTPLTLWQKGEWAEGLNNWSTTRRATCNRNWRWSGEPQCQISWKSWEREWERESEWVKEWLNESLSQWKGELNCSKWRWLFAGSQKITAHKHQLPKADRDTRGEVKRREEKRKGKRRMSQSHEWARSSFLSTSV